MFRGRTNPSTLALAQAMTIQPAPRVTIRISRSNAAGKAAGIDLDGGHTKIAFKRLS
jgi:hypothetical protein